MSSSRIILWAVLMMLVCAGACVRADDAAPNPQPAEKISVPVTVQPKEIRTYGLSVDMKGRVPVPDSDPVDIDALNTMAVQHKYGVREGDGLLPLEITARDAQTTVGKEKVNLAGEDFPKLTLLLDRSWKVTSLFGISGTRYAGQVPCLNYGNLILLFLVPDITKPHAIGESWASKVKLPCIPDEVTITTTIKSVGQTDGEKSVTLHEEFVWAQQKLAENRTADSKAAVDSTFQLDNGKLLKSHADCQITFHDPAKTKPEEKQYAATSKIDVVLDKRIAPAP